MSKKDLSELTMAEAFEKCLCKPGHFSDLPIFQSVFREVICQQGIVDFVASPNSKLTNHPIREITKSVKSNGTGSVRVLSLLKPKAPRTVQYIIKRTGYSNHTARHILSTLMRKGLVRQNTKGSYVLYRKTVIPQVELWAFELKLRNWKRALFQALQCKAFANYVVVVFPKNRKALLNKHLYRFRKMRIGVILFDPIDESHDFLVKPLKDRPTSRMHYLYTFSQIAARVK